MRWIMKKTFAVLLGFSFLIQGSLPAYAQEGPELGRGFELRWGRGNEQIDYSERKGTEPILLASLNGQAAANFDPYSNSGFPARQEMNQNLAVLYPSLEFDPYIGVGMILVVSLQDQASGKLVGQPTVVKVRSDDVVSVPGLGPLKIVGKKLSYAEKEIRKLTGQNFQVGLMMGDVNSVQVLGKVQKPGNYPGDLPLSALIAEAMDRAPGSNYRIHVFNGATRKAQTYKYEDVVKGKDNPIVPAGSIVYFYASASAIFGEMTKEQINLAYLIVITLSALGITLIVKQ